MGLPKGHTNNIKGRPKGSINKMSSELRESITIFLTNNFNQVMDEWQKLEGKDKLIFFKDLLKYAVPMMSNVQFETEFDRLPDDQLDLLIQKIEKMQYEQARKN